MDEGKSEVSAPEGPTFSPRFDLLTERYYQVRRDITWILLAEAQRQLDIAKQAEQLGVLDRVCSAVSTNSSRATAMKHKARYWSDFLKADLLLDLRDHEAVFNRLTGLRGAVLEKQKAPVRGDHPVRGTVVVNFPEDGSVMHAWTGPDVPAGPWIDGKRHRKPWHDGDSDDPVKFRGDRLCGLNGKHAHTCPQNEW
jgi:hypothetical protein